MFGSFLNTVSKLVRSASARGCHLGSKIRPLRCAKVLTTTPFLICLLECREWTGGEGWEKESLAGFQDPGVCVCVCVWGVIIAGGEADFYWAGFSGGLKAPLHPFPGGRWLS